MKKDLGILWFRRDLRLHDNEALWNIVHSTKYILPVYVIDPRLVGGILPGGLPRMGPTRLLFLLESLKDLRQNLREKGSDLLIRVGKPEEVLFTLAEELRADGIYCNRERMPFESKVQDELEKRLWSLGQELYFSRGKMLFHTSDLPFPVARTPDHFGTFLKETEHFINIRRPIASRDLSLEWPDIDIDTDWYPGQEDLGFPGTFHNPDFQGGETSGEKRLAESIENNRRRETPHLHISPWLSLGNLSPKHIYYTVTDTGQIDEKSKRLLIRKLILRDYYRLLGKKEPTSMFSENGFRHKEDMFGQWDSSLLSNWIAGETGHEYVDACMKCLAATGYLNHHQRKVVAHFLINEMKVHWLLGAGYFQSVLLDYDPCSNYGNWQRAAGLSPDLKGRYGLNFDLVADQLDPNGNFRHRWKNFEVRKYVLK